MEDKSSAVAESGSALHGAPSGSEPSAAAVHRICHLIREGGCKNCPETEVHHGEECTRGCYMQAAECVNTVETGNPWRKTGDVRAPWVVLPAIAREHSSPRQVEGQVPGPNSNSPISKTPPAPRKTTAMESHNHSEGGEP